MHMTSDQIEGRGWWVSEDGVEVIRPEAMAEWADAGFVSDTDEDDGSVYLTLPPEHISERFHPSTQEGLRLSSLRDL